VVIIRTAAGVIAAVVCVVLGLEGPAAIVGARHCRELAVRLRHLAAVRDLLLVAVRPLVARALRERVAVPP